ncbi:hypothetical protein FHY15_003172 [Xanthomonas arboricola]|nr:hypothetical protein [Xanthomonas arboricola]
MPSPLAGHAVNPSMEAPWRHPCRQGSRNRQGHRTRKLVDCFVESLPVAPLAVACSDAGRRTPLRPAHAMHRLQPCTPTISTGPCPPTVAGPYAAWMPRKSLQGRTCGVSCDGGRARALQPSHTSSALQSTHSHRLIPSKATERLSFSSTWTFQSRVGRVRGALAACGTRRESVRGGSLAASMPPRVPQPARTPHQEVGRLLS